MSNNKRVVLLTDEEIDTILLWAETIDDEWGLNSDDEEIVEKLKEVRLK